jgi:plasmid stabilization system protein ParE
MSEGLRVVLQRRAIREIQEIDDWWRHNRPAAPELFLTELEATLTVTALMPSLGATIRGTRAPGLRRMLLPRTRYHLYYRVRGDVLEVLALWHARRGSGPDL